LELPESVQGIGRAQMTQVEVKGICHQCAAAGEPSPKRRQKEVAS
jgi:hypothetical protein